MRSWPQYMRGVTTVQMSNLKHRVEGDQITGLTLGSVNGSI